MQEQVWLWLAAGLGPGAQNSGAVLAAFAGGAPQVWEERKSDKLRMLLAKKQAQRLLESTPNDFLPELERNRQRQVLVLPFPSPLYPQMLKPIDSPPPVLYVKGDASLLNGHLCIGMVGARGPSAYGVDVMKTLSRSAAAAGVVVVSGLAAGLDAEAHKGALAAQGATIACIAFGHGRCYPANNRQLLEVVERYGAVVSEYPLDTEPEKAYFLQRNRLIAGLSQGVLVAEARHHSGTMSTINFAAEYGRDVFAVPGSIFSPLSGGTNALLAEGAILAGSAEDILAQYGQARLGEVPAGGGVPLLKFASRSWQHRPQQPALLGQNFQQLCLPEEPEPPAPQLAPRQAKEEPRHAGNEIPPPVVSEMALQVLGCLGALPTGLTQICGQSGLAPGPVMAALTELELAGLSRQLAGRQFVVMQ